MATLDFSELSSKPVGETFEGLIRMVGERLGVTVSWTGRGADQGRDLVFVEAQSGRIGSTPVRWLVSCKDNSKSNQAVSEQEVGSIVDKVRQHGCDAFLLATTTTAGTALKAKLDALASNERDRIQTKVWDRFELTRMLLSDQFADLLRQFFPKQNAQNAVRELDAARQKVEASVPRQVVGAIRRHLVPHSERYASLTGAAVWPHDADQQKIIDQLRAIIVNRPLSPLIVPRLDELHFDAFLALADRVIRTFPTQAYDYLLSYAQTTTDNSRLFNLIELLREFDQFSDDLEQSIAARCDEETLWDLYHETVEEGLTDTSYWDADLPSEIAQFHQNIEIVNIEVDDLQFSGGDAVTFSATLRLDVSGSTDEGEHGYPTEQKSFLYKVSGYPDGARVSIDDVKFRY
ncbi:restriction endonuclease [Bradyrhizobium sp. NAS96.2]|uniref:restriction endonuclease n=1 Tax=Bradyrhizobium sp. NAS96.2 TaxID=1680160 RepID=UPI00093902AB|nr:restriction endonuclease [Bradyrhizobium sp. NAS96.2]OKO76370.1 hypothetical protein AC628_18120 [Bradyrhizobium sp. NAS96.2]